jgi:hypothetical protein
LGHACTGEYFMRLRCTCECFLRARSLGKSDKSWG